MAEGAPTNTDASLVLFVGPALQPDAGLHQMLAADGMRCLWLRGHEQALVASGFAAFDAIVIDANELGSAATRVIAALRAALRCPIVVVAPHADEIDEIVALELGADAHLTRPLAPRRLRAHLGALLRLRAMAPPMPQRHPGLAEPREHTVAGWTLSRVHNRLHNGADNGADNGAGSGAGSGAGKRVTQIDLTDVQAALLASLMARAGEVVPRAALAAALPQRRELHSRSIDVYVHRLRLRLREMGVSAFVIEAVRSRGYRLCVELRLGLPDRVAVPAGVVDSARGSVFEHAA